MWYIIHKYLNLQGILVFSVMMNVKSQAALVVIAVARSDRHCLFSENPSAKFTKLLFLDFILPSLLKLGIFRKYTMTPFLPTAV